MRGYRLFTIDFDESDVEDQVGREPSLDPHDKRQTRRYGDGWAEARRSLVLRVPSVVVPFSFNHVVNPDHPRYDPRAVTAHGRFEYDERIGRLIATATAAINKS